MRARSVTTMFRSAFRILCRWNVLSLKLARLPSSQLTDKFELVQAGGKPDSDAVAGASASGPQGRRGGVGRSSALRAVY